MLNCTTSAIDCSHSSKWMPLTGLYIAAATLVCVIAIIGDLLKGLWSKQYWIPSGYTALNSISLTILGAAAKLSMDLSTTMPQQIDQLAKLGTSAFMCIALACIHPSLGKLENNELLSNVVALSILVVSSIVSLCIQLRTGVIYTFETAHIIMLATMRLLLLHCILSAGLLSFFKPLYQDNYEEQDMSARKELIYVEGIKHPLTENLKQYLEGYSMCAYSYCPHFLLGRSSQGTPPTIYGLVAAMVFFSTCVTSISHKDKFVDSTPSNRSSGYNWSVLWIFTSQTIALGVGTIVLCIRGYYITRVYLKGLKWFGSPEEPLPDNDLVLGRYLYDFTIYLGHKSFIYQLKMVVLSAFHSLFRFLLSMIGVVAFFVIEIFWRLVILVCFCTTKCTCEIPRPEDPASEEEELNGQYISIMMGADSKGSTKWIRKSISDTTREYMSTKERNTENSEELLRQYLSDDFGGVGTLDNEEVALLDNSLGSLPNCWSLLVVTLTNIAIALPNEDRDSIVKLVKGVKEGLVFVKLIEDMFNNKPHFIIIRCAAYSMWMTGFWPNYEDTARPAVQNGSPIEILESIAASAKNDFHKLSASSGVDRYKGVAAHYKYRLCETLLVECRNDNQLSTGRLFEKLRATIADVLGACFTNLKSYILTECSKSSSIERMREAAPSILTFFADTKKIMEIIEKKNIPDMSWEKMVFIDNWREHYHSRRQFP